MRLIFWRAVVITPKRVWFPPLRTFTSPEALFTLVVFVRFSPALNRLDSSMMTVSQNQLFTDLMCFASHCRFSKLIVVISARWSIAAARSSGVPTATA